MYNHMRRCLFVSIKRTFLTQSIESVSSTKLNHYVHHWNHAAYKRFCCKTAIKVEKNKTDTNSKDVTQQKFDQFLSNPENKKFYEILQLEVNVLQSNGEIVPENIETKHWLMLCTMRSKSRRKKYLLYLWKIEKSKANAKAKKDLEMADRLIKWEEKNKNTDEINYGLFNNALFLRIYTKTIQEWFNAKLIRNMMLDEPKIVFDCSYEDHMTSSEIHNCAKQLTLAFAENRVHDSAASLYFCNLNKDGLLQYFFSRNMPNLMNDDFPAFITSQSHLELFPKDQLVYLTPHCRTDMIEYDPDMVYIIGAMVDKSNPQPLSLAKAKKDGIRMVKFPLEKYLLWGPSSAKNLTLNQTLNILLDLKRTRNWEKALQNVPCRKLKASREYALEKKVKKFSYLQAQTFQTHDTETNIQTDLTFASRKK